MLEIEALKRHFAAGPDAAKKKDALKRVIEAAKAQRGQIPGRIAWVGDVSKTPSGGPAPDSG